MLRSVVYDGSFAGLLTAVFDVYEYRYKEVNIFTDAQRQDSLFSESHVVYTDEQKAERLWTGLKKYLSASALTNLYHAYLSEQQGMENFFLQYIQYVFAKKENIESDYGHPAVLYITKLVQKVHRERHRMEAFIRFQRTNDDLYYAAVEPDFNVLPLLIKHFQNRYADQRWMIYDLKRKYGLYYDLHTTQMVELGMAEEGDSNTPTTAILNESEPAYQQLWQHYFNSVNIPARKNMKLHIKHMPLRYWKHLTEKQPVIRR
jgi:probable DNA metabolism protein